MIEVKFRNSKASTADGMRYWAMYLRDAVAKKVSGMTLVSVDGNVATYKLGDTICEFTIVTDMQTFEVSLRLRAITRDGEETTNIPVGALVILMVFLHYIPGRARVGGMVPLQATIGNKTYMPTDKDQVLAAYKALKSLLPEAWYLPYTEDVMDAAECFAARNTVKPKPTK